jgi:UDP-N-acetylmuramoylalanine--D-glutamate ligase
MQQVEGKRVSVYGLGRFGGSIAVTQWLVQQGAAVRVIDDQTEDKLTDSVRQLAGLPVEFNLGKPTEEDFTQADLIVASPAIPPHNAFLQAAGAAGVPITTEIRLFIERCPAPIFGLTGTKGKSTTTALLGEMLRSRFTTYVGGNIGGSLLEQLPKITQNQRVVLELSSYMLHYLGKAAWSPHVALYTMLAADHLEWHGSTEAYLDAKKNLIRYQKPGDFVVVNEQDAIAAKLVEGAVGQLRYFALTDCLPFEMQLPGRHNQLNAQSAYAAAQIEGITWDQAQRAIRDFLGLPHRLQLVHESGGVRWYNDSIATVPDAAVAALTSFPARKVIQIIGGKDKHLPVAVLCAALTDRAKVVLCIGDTGAMLADLLETSRAKGAPGVYHCRDLATAVSLARRAADPGDIVLLSPGYPSYDQFVNFEQRGQTFTMLARQG